MECIEKWECFKRRKETVSVAVKLWESHESIVERNRDYLAKICDIVKLLSKLGLLFRGHDEGTEAKMKDNFLEFCDLFSKFDKTFKKTQLNPNRNPNFNFQTKCDRSVQI